MNALKIEGLSKSFGGVQALKNVSFTVEARERLAIIGPNGAGKTTLFNLLTGHEAADAGLTCFFGRDITTMPIHRRAHLGLSRSFQINTLFPNLSLLTNVLLAVQGTNPTRFHMFRSIITYRDNFARAKELLEAVDLWEKRDDLVSALSYGAQRQVEILLALTSEPKLLLLDEPSCGLTSAESAGITGMIHKLGGDITVLLVGHDMDLVFGVAERIIVLHYGQIIADGVPEEVRIDPRVREIYMGVEEDTENATAS